MTAVAIRLTTLDTESSIIEAASKRVRDAVLEGSLIMIAGVTCWYLNRAQKVGNDLRCKLSKVDVKTAEDRAVLREIASNLGQASQALSTAYARGQETGLGKIPVFGQKLMAKLDSLVCTFEDMSETAALGASDAFAKALQDELRENLESHHRRHAIAG